MGENNFRACEEVQQDEGFRRWGEVGGKKKGGSLATFRGMNAKQGDHKCGDRINTLPNTYGCYYGLWRKSVLIYASRVALSAQSYQWK